MIEPFILSAALVFDHVLGEPKKYHYLVGFGLLTQKLERLANRFSNSRQSRLSGALCWCTLTLPMPLLYYVIRQDNWVFWCLDAMIVYAAIGYKSLAQHALQILKPLNENQLDEARHFCSYLVSRNTTQLSEQEIARATTESVLENGHDAVIASLVWYIMGGAPLVILHRLANTLDAMWGYKNDRFLYFGWFAARMDDILGWPSAKISSLLYSCQGNMLKSLKNAYIQGRQYKSLNGGWVMASGATVLNFKLGGQAVYHGKVHQSVNLGCGKEVQRNDIQRSLLLVKYSAFIFILCITLYHVSFNYVL